MTTTEMQTGLEARVVRPVLIARLDIAGDPVLGWTGPGLFAPSGTGDAALDGQIFDPTEAPVDMSDVVDNQGVGEPVTITMAANDLDQDVLRQLVRDRRVYIGRKAWLWFALLDDTEAAVLPNPERLKTGVIVSMSYTRSPEEEIVEVVIDEDLGGTRSNELRIIDHTRFWPTDTFSSFVHKLVNRPRGIRGAVSTGGGGGGGIPGWKLRH
ncbi:hypothetical protein [Paremcibacter congregatus]|uniref:hypothetical protein n=1 Tax=Paremcibacter congregatus TaxID=2043170 RepID=UPI0030EB5B76|tara:strand:- start:104 stop:736 length:633 start_codon:yes stop_codon:yes gene_type:complete